jgi:hypothetical protein
LKRLKEIQGNLKKMMPRRSEIKSILKEVATKDYQVDKDYDNHLNELLELEAELGDKAPVLPSYINEECKAQSESGLETEERKIENQIRDALTMKKEDSLANSDNPPSNGNLAEEN